VECKVLILSSEDERFSGWRYETWYGKGKRQSRGRIGAGRVFVRVVMGVGYGRRHREGVKGGTRRQGKHNFVKDLGDTTNRKISRFEVRYDRPDNERVSVSQVVG
jgi:hypothetical protein